MDDKEKRRVSRNSYFIGIAIMGFANTILALVGSSFVELILVNIISACILVFCLILTNVVEIIKEDK